MNLSPCHNSKVLMCKVIELFANKLHSDVYIIALGNFDSVTSHNDLMRNLVAICV
jgi:hypothetical protein